MQMQQLSNFIELSVIFILKGYPTKYNNIINSKYLLVKKLNILKLFNLTT